MKKLAIVLATMLSFGITVAAQAGPGQAQAVDKKDGKKDEKSPEPGVEKKDGKKDEPAAGKKDEKKNEPAAEKKDATKTSAPAGETK